MRWQTNLTVIGSLMAAYPNYNWLSIDSKQFNIKIAYSHADLDFIH